MKLWKVLIFAPYILIFGWILIWSSVMTAGALETAIVGGALVGIGIGYGILYTIVLAVALIVRWIIMWRRRKNV